MFVDLKFLKFMKQFKLLKPGRPLVRYEQNYFDLAS